MKKRASVIILLLLSFLCAFLGCYANTDIPKEDTVYIAAVNENGVFFEKNTYITERGNNVSLTFAIKEGLSLNTCIYSGEYRIEEEGEGRYTLHLFNVQYDARISITTNRLKGKIYYYLNGGSFTDETNNGDYFMVEAVAGKHLRLNTDIGRNIVRDGYTQIGWNTKADGSGKHIGLGSRITVDAENTTVLYAEWEKWTSDDYFTYVTNHTTKETGDISITQYHGPQTIDRLSIPAYINGKKVTCIDKNFSSGLQINTLILPNTMLTVAIGSFEKSEIQEIYFFDNLREVSNGTFGKTIANIHINAAVAPRYMGISNNSHFADNMDRLILNATKKKIIFFAGCSMSYGLNSPMVEEAFEEKYVICDMGVIGGTNAWFQYLCMIPYLQDGDIFIHAPEQMSPYQFLHTLRAEQRMFVCVESNYDLLASIDCSNISAFFDCFKEYNDIRLIMPESSYETYNAEYNEYGDIVMERPNSPEDANFGLTPLFKLKMLTEEAFERLNYIYGLMAERGVNVFFSFAPLNKNALSEEDVATEIWLTFENTLRENLIEDVKIISSAENYLIEGKYFYDTDYHMSQEGAVIRTEKLIHDIKNALE